MTNKQTWIKAKLLNYLKDNNLTIGYKMNSYPHKLGIIPDRGKNPNCLERYVNEYLVLKISEECSLSEAFKFIEYLFSLRNENKKEFISYLKKKSPLIREREGDNFNCFHRDIINIISKDQDFLFNYIISNNKFILNNYNSIISLLKTSFTVPQKQIVIEKYLNSHLINNLEFERKIFALIKELGLSDKYLSLLPNLSKEHSVLNLSNFSQKECQSFEIMFSENQLLPFVPKGMLLSEVFGSLGNIEHLLKINSLGIETVRIFNSFDVNSKVKQKTIIFFGTNLNIPFIKIAVQEYLESSLESNRNFPHYSFKFDFKGINLSIPNLSIPQQSFITYQNKLLSCFLNIKLQPKSSSLSINKI